MACLFNESGAQRRAVCRGFQENWIKLALKVEAVRLNRLLAKLTASFFLACEYENPVLDKSGPVGMEFKFPAVEFQCLKELYSVGIITIE